MKNITAKAQSRVRRQKGTRLNKESLTVLAKQAIVAFPERVEKNPHAAYAKGAARWLKHPKNQITFQWTGTPK